MTENVKTCIHDQLFQRFTSFKMNVYFKKKSALFYQVEMAYLWVKKIILKTL